MELVLGDKAHKRQKNRTFELLFLLYKTIEKYLFKCVNK